MRMKKTWLYVSLGVLLIAVSGTLYILSHPGSNPPPMNAGPANVLQFQAAKENLANTLEVKGKSGYVKETTVYAPYTGDVVQWHVNDGDQVTKGQPLFVLDGNKLKQEIEQLQSDQKRRTLEAKLRTVEQAAASKGSVELAATEAEALQRTAQSAAQSIRNELQQLGSSTMETELKSKQAFLAKAEQTAPESGILLLADAQIQKPAAVQEGTAVGRIVDVTRLQMTASVGEYDVFRIQPGMPAMVTLDALKQTKLSGKVEKVSKFPKTGTTGTAQFEVVISLDAHENLIAGLSLTASIQTDNKQNVLTVPTIAVQRDKEGSYVMLETDQGIQKRSIQVGLETAEKTEVLQGLQEGDRIVLQ